MNNDLLFNLVYFGLLIFYIVISIISMIVGILRINFNLSIDKLKQQNIINRKYMIVCFLFSVLLPILIIPLYIFSPKYLLIIQFSIIIFSVSFSISFLSFFYRYCKIRKILKGNICNVE